jgi:hypothetical protein
MKTYGGGGGGIALTFVTSALGGGEWPASRPGYGTHLTGSWVGPIAGLVAVE